MFYYLGCKLSLSQAVKSSNKVIGLTQLSNLVECLLSLLNEAPDPTQTGFRRMLDKNQRVEVHKIYMELESRFC